MNTDLHAWSQAEAEGRALYEQADYPRAIVRWIDALVSLEEGPVNARSRARACKGIALAYGRLGEVEAQIRYLQRALEEHFQATAPTTDEDYRFRSECLCRLGEAFRSVGEHVAAADCFAAAAEIAERTAEHVLAIESLIAWGYTAEAEGDLISALNIFSRAREIARMHPELSELGSQADRSIRDILLAALP